VIRVKVGAVHELMNDVKLHVVALSLEGVFARRMEVEVLHLVLVGTLAVQVHDLDEASVPRFQPEGVAYVFQLLISKRVILQLQHHIWVVYGLMVSRNVYR